MLLGHWIFWDSNLIDDLFFQPIHETYLFPGGLSWTRMLKAEKVVVVLKRPEKRKNDLSEKETKLEVVMVIKQTKRLFKPTITT